MTINEMINKYTTYFFNDLQVTLAGLPAKMCPALRFSEGDDCYTDGKVINIGKGFIKATEEDEMVLEVLYILGHEAQHVLSSPDKYWKWGIEHGAYTLASEMCMLLNGYRLKNETELESFCKNARDKGYGITINGLKHIVHHVFNSVEDGRIEAICCKKNFVFRDQMFLYRIRYWQDCKVEDGPEFIDVLNQILFLSTMGMYEKGFLEKYEKTPVADLVESLLPMIGQGVTARSCNDCALACIGIYKLLAPMTLEYFKGNNHAESQLSQNAKDVGQGGMSNSGEASSYPNQSNGEIYNDGNTTGNGSLNGNQSQSGKNEKDATSSSQEKNKGCMENHPFQDLIKNKGQNSVEAKDSEKESDADIESALKRIREQALEMGRESISSAKRMGTRPAPVVKEQFDNEAPITAELLKGNKAVTKHDFKEEKQIYTNYLELPQVLKQRAETFARKLKDVFERENIPEILERKSGKVNTSDLYKLAIGELDFWKKEEEEGDLDTCAYFLCDNSGSMGYGEDSKRMYALETLSIIEEGFKRYMPLKIVAFQKRGQSVVHDLVKNWEEIRRTSNSYNFLVQGPGGSSNADGISIRYATAELLNRPEQKKILFVLSDGLPAYTNGEEDTAIAAEEARKAGIILVPIYFSETTCALDATLNSEEAKRFAKMYQKNYIITIPEQIEDNVISVLTKYVFM